MKLDDLHTLWFVLIENQESWEKTCTGFITKHCPRFKVIRLKHSSSEPLQAKSSMKQKGPKLAWPKLCDDRCKASVNRNTGLHTGGLETTYLDDVTVFDNLSQELLVLRLILLLLQFSGMLRERQRESDKDVPDVPTSVEHNVDEAFINLAPVVFWTGPPVCCCFPVCLVLPSRTASVPSICSWDTP